MKYTLTLFVITILCSYALSTALEATVHSLISNNNMNRKDSTLNAGRLIHSKNGEYTLTITADSCQMVLKDKNQKNLYSTPVTKSRDCRLVLRGSSNLEIKSGKTIVWSTRTSPAQSGKGPYRLTITNKGNPIVRNNQRQCVWALFGCPIPAEVKKKIKSAPPKEAYRLIQRIMTGQRQRRNSSPLIQLPVAKGKPRIQNQKPKFLKRNHDKSVKPSAPASKFVVSPKVVNRVRRLFSGSNLSSPRTVKRITRSLKGKASKREIKQLKRLVKQGLSWEELRRRALRKIQKDINRKKAKLAKRSRNVVPGKMPVITSKRQLIKKVAQLTWVEQIKNAFNSGAKYDRIQSMLRSMGNVRGSDYFWTQVQSAVSSRNWGEFLRLISLPPSRTLTIQRPKRWVTRGRYVSRWVSWVTWRWEIRYSGWWSVHCRGRWWWRRCWWHWNSNNYWYQYYYWTGNWTWNYQTYSNLE